MIDLGPLSKINLNGIRILQDSNMPNYLSKQLFVPRSRRKRIISKCRKKYTILIMNPYIIFKPSSDTIICSELMYNTISESKILGGDMKRFSLLFSDGKDFIFIPNKEVCKKLFGNKKDAVIYIKKSKNRYITEGRSISLYDLEQCGFKKIKANEEPQEVLTLLNEFI